MNENSYYLCEHHRTHKINEECPFDMDVFRIIVEFKREHPELEIEFEVKLKPL